MNSEPTGTDAREDALLAGVYAQLEEDFLPNQRPAYDVEAGRTRFLAWLEDDNGTVDVDDEAAAGRRPAGITIMGGDVHLTTAGSITADPPPTWAELVRVLLEHDDTVRARRGRIGRVTLSAVCAFAAATSALLAFTPRLSALLTVAVVTANVLVAATGMVVHVVGWRGRAADILQLLARDPGQEDRHPQRRAGHLRAAVARSTPAFGGRGSLKDRRPRAGAGVLAGWGRSPVGWRWPITGRPSEGRPPRSFERWGIHSQIPLDQATLLGYEDARANQRAGQLNISANHWDLLARLGQQFAEARMPAEERLARLGARLAPLRHRMKWVEAELDEAIRARDESRAQVAVLANRRGKIFLDQRRMPRWTYLPLMLVFVVAELILNSTALLIIGEGNLAVLVLAGTLVVAILVICHFIGDALQEAEEDPRRRRRVWWLVVAAVLILAFLWAIGAITVQVPHSGIRGDLLGAYLLQLPVIAAAVIAAYLYANGHANGLAQRERAVKKARREFSKLDKTHAVLQAELDAAEARRIQTVQLYLDWASVVQDHSRGLQAVYASSYAQAKGEPPNLPELEQAHWVRDWTRWFNEHGDDSPSIRGNAGSHTIDLG